MATGGFGSFCGQRCAQSFIPQNDDKPSAGDVPVRVDVNQVVSRFVRCVGGVASGEHHAFYAEGLWYTERGRISQTLQHSHPPVRFFISQVAKKCERYPGSKWAAFGVAPDGTTTAYAFSPDFPGGLEMSLSAKTFMDVPELAMLSEVCGGSCAGRVHAHGLFSESSFT